MHLTLNRANATQLMKAVANNENVGGWLSTDAKFQFQGRNEAEAVASLTGGAVVQGEVKAILDPMSKAAVLGTQVLGSALGGAVDKFSQTLTSLTDGFTSPLVGALSMVGLLMVDEPGKLSGFVDFKNGHMTERDLQIVNSKLALVTQGWMNLPVYRQDFAVEAYNLPMPRLAPGQAAAPYIAVQLRGPLDKANRRLYGDRVNRGVSTGPAGAANVLQDLLKGSIPGTAQPAPAPAGTPAPAAKPSTADQLKGILDVLTKPKQ